MRASFDNLLVESYVAHLFFVSELEEAASDLLLILKLAGGEDCDCCYYCVPDFHLILEVASHSYLLSPK